MKKLLLFLLAIITIFSSAIPAFAVEEPHTSGDAEEKLPLPLFGDGSYHPRDLKLYLTEDENDRNPLSGRDGTAIIGIPHYEWVEITRKKTGDDDWFRSFYIGWSETAPTRARFISNMLEYLSLSNIDLETAFPLIHKEMSSDFTFDYKDVGIKTFLDNMAMAWAAQHGLVKGDQNGKFRPNERITFYEAITVMARVNELLFGNSVEYYSQEFAANNRGITPSEAYPEVPEWARGSYVAFIYGFGAEPNNTDFTSPYSLLCFFIYIGVSTPVPIPPRP